MQEHEKLQVLSLLIKFVYCRICNTIESELSIWTSDYQKIIYRLHFLAARFMNSILVLVYFQVYFRHHQEFSFLPLF